MVSRRPSAGRSANAADQGNAQIADVPRCKGGGANMPSRRKRRPAPRTRRARGRTARCLNRRRAGPAGRRRGDVASPSRRSRAERGRDRRFATLPVVHGRDGGGAVSGATVGPVNRQPGVHGANLTCSGGVTRTDRCRRGRHVHGVPDRSRCVGRLRASRERRRDPGPVCVVVGADGSGGAPGIRLLSGAAHLHAPDAGRPRRNRGRGGSAI